MRKISFNSTSFLALTQNPISSTKIMSPVMNLKVSHLVILCRLLRVSPMTLIATPTVNQIAEPTTIKVRSKLVLILLEPPNLALTAKSPIDFKFRTLRRWSKDS